jgi:teichoic acid transport system permease protein
MAQTVVAESDTARSLRELARRHGLHAADALPSLPAYARLLWSYRHFISAYADAQVSSSLSTTRLGRLWQVLTPLTNAAVYFLIFGVILGTKNGVHNFIAYLCTGLFVFAFSQAVAQKGIQSITGNLGLIRALHFPRASLPIAVVLVEAQNLIASMTVLMAIVLLTGEPLTFEWLLIVPILLMQAIFNTGLGMGLARLGSKLTDLKQLMPFIMRTWMYGSAVLYPVSRFKGLPHWAQHIIEANPLLIYIELMRHALLEDVVLAAPLTRLWLVGAGWALVVGTAGFVYFWRGEKGYGRG